MDDAMRLEYALTYGITLRYHNFLQTWVAQCSDSYEDVITVAVGETRKEAVDALIAIIQQWLPVH